MKEKFKFIFIILFTAFFLFSCSGIKTKFDKMFSKDEKENTKTEKNVEKEKTLKVPTSSDLNFYNKYIEVSNNISEKVEELNRSYYSEVPDPATLRANSMVFVISFGINVSSLETILKQYKRSLFDGGDLAKLDADDKALKTTLETDFKNLLPKMYDLHDISADIDSYYKNKDFKTDPSKAKKLDTSYKEKYKAYDESYKTLKKDMRELKPVFAKKDPDNIKDPDEKAIVLMQNGYEKMLDKAEATYEKFEGMKAGSDTKDLNTAFNELEDTYDELNAKINKTEFTDRTKYIKYSYEDYFSKMYVTFSKNMTSFIAYAKAKHTPKEFAGKYDEVLRSYNNLITSYNSSINVINSFKIYK